MTDSSEPSAPARRTHPGRRFVVAFLAGIIAILGIGAGALYAYDVQYVGRVLPGVSVGGVDLSGLDPGTARSRLAETFGRIGSGRIILNGPAGEMTIGYAELGRTPDLDGMLDAALAAGREDGVSRFVGNARVALHGVSIGPAATLDVSKLDAQLAQVARAVDRTAVDATIEVLGGSYAITTSTDGRTLDVAALRERLVAALSVLDAPSEIRLDLPVTTIEPSLTTEEVTEAKEAAERLTAPLTIEFGNHSWTLSTKRLRAMTSFTPTYTGVTPIVDTQQLDASLRRIAKKVDRTPQNASYLVGRGGKVVGVTAGANGRKMLIGATRDLVVDVLMARVHGAAGGKVTLQVAPQKPSLTTDEARKAAPLMRRISTWTTWFPIGIKNGFGANIWLPASFIDGTVVAPGETFDFFKAIGPVTRQRGFRQGGAIIDGRTEPQGALAGGICSCSTTMFNAALRAGFKMGARRNHFYYIDRYPLGLDATVFSSHGSTQTMTWTNDTKYPVLVRAFNTRSGGKGFVRFDLYSVPNGRSVIISRPIVKNVRPASDTIQYTTALAPGHTERIEFPVDGKDVWVTVTVMEHGQVISRRTYYSHYSRITGVTLVGRAADAPAA
jgi:vancomycin resistance protein YoaR